MNLIALAELLMITGGAASIGVGANSWLIGIGTWICCVALYKSDKR